LCLDGSTALPYGQASAAMLADGAAEETAAIPTTVAAERKISSSTRQQPFFAQRGHIYA